MIISIASRAATFRIRAESHESCGMFTVSLRSSDFDGVPFSQKCSMKMLQTLPYSDRTLLSSERFESVANFKLHLEERMSFIDEQKLFKMEVGERFREIILLKTCKYQKQ